MADHPVAADGSRENEFPFTEWQLGLEAAAGRLTGRVRNCARNAFVHLRGAWTLHHVDDEMALFRALTAEEEAATALMHALKTKGYAGAERLRPRDHRHKNALWPVVEAVSRIIAETRMPEPKVGLSKVGPPKISLRIDMAAMAGTAEPMWAEPDHPLNFTLGLWNDGERLLHYFDEQFAELAAERGVHSLREHLTQAANLRNQLLYADDAGCPMVSFDDTLLKARAIRVGILFAMTIIVMQTPVHQLFVTQCLEALLRLLAANEGISFDYSEADQVSGRPTLVINREEGEDPKVWVRRPIAVSGIWGNQGWMKPAQLRAEACSAAKVSCPEPPAVGRSDDNHYPR